MTVFAKDYPDRYAIETHTHASAQLLFAASGTMRVTTALGCWLVPPLRAVWIPAGMEHAVAMEGSVAMRTLYLQSGSGLPAGCTVLKVRAFLRALILEAVSGGLEPERSPRDRWLSSLLLLELKQAATESLFVPMPKDARLRAVCHALLQVPGSEWTLDRWGEQVGASPRTLARLFQAELGMGFRAWRDQVRLAAAIPRLSSGEAVAQIATELGYRSPSAFTAMFRRNLGSSPTTYLAAE